MLNTLLLTAFLLSPQGAKAAPAEQDYTGPRKRAAVSGFDVLIKSWRMSSEAPSGLPVEADIVIDEPTEFGDGMADMLVTALIDSKRFVLLERRDLKEVEDELKIQKDSMVSEESIVKAGQLLGAQVLIRGALTELSFKKNTTGLGAGILEEIVGGTANFVATVGIDLKLIDVETGQILDSVHCEGRVGNKTSYVGFANADFAIGHASFDNSPVAKAIRAAIKDGVKKISARLERMPWEARIASVSQDGDSQLLYLNFGEGANIKVGTTLELFRPGKTIIDPQTREALGREEDRVLGTCRVRSVKPKFSIAVVTSGSGYEVGDGVRLAERSGG